MAVYPFLCHGEEKNTLKTRMLREKQYIQTDWETDTFMKDHHVIWCAKRSWAVRGHVWGEHDFKGHPLSLHALTSHPQQTHEAPAGQPRGKKVRGNGLQLTQTHFGIRKRIDAFVFLTFCTYYWTFFLRKSGQKKKNTNINPTNLPVPWKFQRISQNKGTNALNPSSSITLSWK